jgi:hypothetical protein
VSTLVIFISLFSNSNFFNPLTVGSILFFITMFFMEGAPKKPEPQSTNEIPPSGIDNRSYIPDNFNLHSVNGQTTKEQRF